MRTMLAVAIVLVAVSARGQPAEEWGKLKGLLTQKPVASRVARLPTCPTGEDVRAKCPGGFSQMDGYCLCFAASKDVSGEQKTAPQNRMLVCEVTGDDGKKHLVVRYEDRPAVDPLDAGCVLVVSDLLFPGVSVEYQADVDKLGARCAPCPITGKLWGPCPYCLHPSYGRTCAQACPVK